ncbi:cytochrome P450 [Mycena crocata]|nr:cytochrome P450 [Mycena crocata]
MQLSPGVRSLVSNLLLPAIAISFARAIANVFGLALSVWTVLWAFLGGALVFVVGKTAVMSVYHKLHAKSMGARLAPQIKGRWPGNIDVLKHLLEIYETGYLGDGFSEIVQSLGPVFNLRLLWSSHVFTVSPEHIQIILATDFNNYVKGERFRSTMGSVLGDGVFNSDGEMWSFHRSMTLRHFEIFDQHAEKIITLIKDRMSKGQAIDFQDLASRFTMDAATEFLFGNCIDSLSGILPRPHSSPHTTEPQSKQANSNDFPSAFNEVMLQIAFRERVGWVWPLLEMFGDRTAKPMDTVTRFIDPIVHNAVEKKKRTAGAGVKSLDFEGMGDSDTLLDELLNSTTDPKLLRDEILNILLAGRETTMHTLTVTIYFLAMYPKVTARLRDEIMNVVGPSNRPSYANIKEMKYLRAVINETLRLYPAVFVVLFSVFWSV